MPTSAHNVGLHITPSFVFPSDVFLFMTLLSSLVLMNRCWHVVQFQNAHRPVAWLLIFLNFMSDLKKL